MTASDDSRLRHPDFHRRAFLQAGAIAALGGLSMSDVAALRAAPTSSKAPATRPKSVIYIVLTGGLAQHESFDPKSEAPADVRGEFDAIETATPGLFISEHLPKLAARSEKWALCRSLSHTWNEHIQATSMMLTGRSILSPSFSRVPKPTDFPGITSVAGRLVPPRNNLPNAAVLPYSIDTPGTKAGIMGASTTRGSSKRLPTASGRVPARTVGIINAGPSSSTRDGRCFGRQTCSSPTASLSRVSTDARVCCR